MAVDEGRLQEKRENAIEILYALAQFLDDVTFSSWAAKFREVANDFEQKNDRMAIHLHKLVTGGGGMGSFCDLCLQSTSDPTPEDHARFGQLRGSAHSAIANIRLYREHEVDHPLIDVTQPRAPLRTIEDKLSDVKWWQV